MGEMCRSGRESFTAPDIIYLSVGFFTDCLEGSSVLFCSVLVLSSIDIIIYLH